MVRRVVGRLCKITTSPSADSSRETQNEIEGGRARAVAHGEECVAQQRIEFYELTFYNPLSDLRGGLGVAW